MNPDNDMEFKTSRVISKWWIFVTALITVLICSAISWMLISNSTVAKTEYTSDITEMNNTIGHLQDAIAGLDSYASYQNSTIQTKLNDINSELIGINNDLNDINNDFINNNNEHNTFYNDISDIKVRLDSISASLTEVTARVSGLDTAIVGINTAVANINTAIADIKTMAADLDTTVNSLTSTVNQISGLQIIPTITKSTSGGTISLAINSNQTVTSQIVAFSVEFSAKSDIPLKDTLDASLQNLYEGPPLILYPGGSGKPAVTVDHITYNLYWASGKYHLGSITFQTIGTSIAKGANTKTLVYTLTGSTVYDIVVTPGFEPATTSAGVAVSTW